MRIILVFACTIVFQWTSAQIKISTVDITHFWEAYDALPKSGDSVLVIQRLYLDRSSEGMKDFIKARKLTAPEYVKLIRKFPKFWASIRPNSLAVLEKQKDLEEVFIKFKERYPGFKPPKICFAIGCMRTGGTTSPDQILIGTELASSDATTDASETSGWLKSVIGSIGNVVDMVAHEAVHTQQVYSKTFSKQQKAQMVMVQSIREGAADFVSMEIAGTNINPKTYAYGNEHLEELKEEFYKAMDDSDLSQWLYNGSKSKTRPADLGYFMGYKICEAYYNQAQDKVKALVVLMEAEDPLNILQESGFYSYKATK